MREIQFRAWDSKKNRMYSAEQMGIDELQLNPDGRGFFNASGITQRLSEYYPWIIPLQFTGLKDKNGKEIYEGDIVAWDYEYDADYDGDMPIVKRSTGKAKVKDIFDRWQINEAAREGRGVEVIGNIYENPELLTP